MNVEALQSELFQKIGAFRPGGLRLIVFDRILDAARHSNVVYAYELADQVSYFGETSGSAVSRNAKLASDTRCKIDSGLPLNGAAWRLLEAIEQQRTVSVWTGPALLDMTRTRRRELEQDFMRRFDTIDNPHEREHPYRWNNYRLR